MTILEEVRTPSVAVAPEAIHVGAWIPDAELRAWVLDELALLAWSAPLEVEIIDDASMLAEARHNLVILDLDGIAHEQIKSLSPLERPPVIAIRTAPSDINVG